MKSKNLYNEDYIIDTMDVTSIDGYNKTKEFILNNDKLPTAFFVETDTIATGAFKGFI